jgi:carboxyl-terminal processing protease
MVQRQLKALGYDPGNTDGTESMQTSIAISQFQAENKMQVTGKASPQLAGVLSARLSGN